MSTSGRCISEMGSNSSDGSAEEADPLPSGLHSKAILLLTCKKPPPTKTKASSMTRSDRAKACASVTPSRCSAGTCAGPGFLRMSFKVHFNCFTWCDNWRRRDVLSGAVLATANRCLHTSQSLPRDRANEGRGLSKSSATASSQPEFTPAFNRTKTASFCMEMRLAAPTSNSAAILQASSPVEALITTRSTQSMSPKCLMHS
mmetsp:Transcript_81242/g.263394  ORF Transcript_81242/g.263394 Transcript_81242/m.263394 type:complete len:202 (-) Transcript_81242:949-1554(-)